MVDPSLALQGAIVSYLRSYAPLVALVGQRVYDSVPEKAPTPYITLGEDQIIVENADCLEGSEFYLTLHAWSDEPGYTQVKNVSGTLREAFTDDTLITVAGFRLIDLRVESTRHMRDPNGVTSHAVMTLQGFIEPI